MTEALRNRLCDHQERPAVGARTHLSNEYPGHSDRLVAHTMRIRAGLNRRRRRTALSIPEGSFRQR